MSTDEIGPVLRQQLEEASENALKAENDEALAELHAIQVDLRRPFPNGMTLDMAEALFGDDPDLALQFARHRRLREHLDEAVRELGGDWTEHELTREALEGWE
jgi:hypothetical protein